MPPAATPLLTTMLTDLCLQSLVESGRFKALLKFYCISTLLTQIISIIYHVRPIFITFQEHFFSPRWSGVPFSSW